MAYPGKGVGKTTSMLISKVSSFSLSNSCCGSLPPKQPSCTSPTGQEVMLREGKVESLHERERERGEKTIAHM